MREDPSGHEVVVVGVQLVLFAPVFVREAVHEGRVLQDVGAVGRRPTRQARDAPVQMRRGRDLKVSPLEVDGAQEAPEVGPLGAPEPLARSHAADAFLLERGEHPLQDRGGPAHVVVGEDGDPRADLGDGPAHLATLVGLGHAEGSQPRRRQHGPHQPRQSLAMGVGRHQQDLERPGRETAPDRLAQALAIALERRYDDRHVVGVEGRLLGERDWSEGPV